MFKIYSKEKSLFSELVSCIKCHNDYMKFHLKKPYRYVQIIIIILDYRKHMLETNSRKEVDRQKHVEN